MNLKENVRKAESIAANIGPVRLRFSKALKLQSALRTFLPRSRIKTYSIASCCAWGGRSFRCAFAPLAATLM
jgi:hypothetical protein